MAWHRFQFHDMHVQSIRNRRSSQNRLSKGLTPNNRLSPTSSCSKNPAFVFLAIVVLVPVSMELFLRLDSSKPEQRNLRVVKEHATASPQNWGRKFWNQNWKMKAALSPFRSEFKIFVYNLPPKFNKDLLERNFNFINEQLDSSQIDCLSIFYSAECCSISSLLCSYSWHLAHHRRPRCTPKYTV